MCIIDLFIWIIHIYYGVKQIVKFLTVNSSVFNSFPGCINPSIITAETYIQTIHIIEKKLYKFHKEYP